MTSHHGSFLPPKESSSSSSSSSLSSSSSSLVLHQPDWKPLGKSCAMVPSNFEVWFCLTKLEFRGVFGPSEMLPMTESVPSKECSVPTTVSSKVNMPEWSLSFERSNCRLSFQTQLTMAGSDVDKRVILVDVVFLLRNFFSLSYNVSLTYAPYNLNKWAIVIIQVFK